MNWGIEMKKLVIIYGSPRTGTSFLHECLCSHKSCSGSEKTSEPESKYGIVPSLETVEAFQETKDLIDMLWDEHCRGEEECLVMKSPGFCNEDEYLALKKLPGYDCKFIHTSRSPEQVVDSMLRHEISKSVLGIVIEGTDCPKRFLPLFKPLWDEADDSEVGLINKGFIRFLWYLKSISPQQVNESLVLEYEDRVKLATSKKIEKYLGILHDTKFQNKMKRFECRRLSVDRIGFIEGSIIPDLEFMRPEY